MVEKRLKVVKSVEKYAIKFVYVLKPPKGISKVCYEKRSGLLTIILTTFAYLYGCL